MRWTVILALILIQAARPAGGQEQAAEPAAEPKEAFGVTLPMELPPPAQEEAASEPQTEPAPPSSEAPQPRPAEEAAPAPAPPPTAPAAPAPAPEAAAPEAPRAPAPVKPEGLGTEAWAALQFGLPRHADWQRAYGVAAGARWWKWNRWGLEGGVGWEEWSASGETPDIPSTAAFRSATVKGAATVWPCTVGLCYRHAGQSKLEWLLHGGLRYAVVDSEVSVEVSYIEHGGRHAHRDLYVENVNNLLGYLGAELSSGIGERAFWTVGAEVQFDLDGSKANWLREEVANDFTALALRAGLGYEW